MEDVKLEINPIDMYVDSAMVSLDQIIGNQQVSTVNILIFALSLMQVVEKLPNIKGAQKKEIVQRVFTKYMETHSPDSMHLLALLPSFVDTSVGLEKGQITIQVSAEEVMSCCASLLSVFARKEKR